MTKTDKIFFYLLLFVPLISSILSTIHIIDFAKLGNSIGMAYAVALTFEISSIVSFVVTGGNILKNINKGWLYIIFILVFILQCVGNTYSGFDYINQKLLSDPKWLSSFQEMTFSYFTLSETKLILSALIGIPLPLISLIMLKFALDKASVSQIYDKIEETNIDSDINQDEIKDDVIIPHETISNDTILKNDIIEINNNNNIKPISYNTHESKPKMDKDDLFKKKYPEEFGM